MDNNTFNLDDDLYIDNSNYVNPNPNTDRNSVSADSHTLTDMDETADMSESNILALRTYCHSLTSLESNNTTVENGRNMSPFTEDERDNFASDLSHSDHTMNGNNLFYNLEGYSINPSVLYLNNPNSNNQGGLSNLSVHSSTPPPIQSISNMDSVFNSNNSIVEANNDDFHSQKNAATLGNLGDMAPVFNFMENNQNSNLPTQNPNPHVMENTRNIAPAVNFNNPVIDPNSGIFPIENNTGTMGNVSHVAPTYTCPGIYQDFDFNQNLPIPVDTSDNYNLTETNIQYSMNEMTLPARSKTDNDSPVYHIPIFEGMAGESSTSKTEDTSNLNISLFWNNQIIPQTPVLIPTHPAATVNTDPALLHKRPRPNPDRHFNPLGESTHKNLIDQTMNILTATEQDQADFAALTPPNFNVADYSQAMRRLNPPLKGKYVYGHFIFANDERTPAEIWASTANMVPLEQCELQRQRFFYPVNCGNCTEYGHELLACTRNIDEQGFLNGCPRCNTVEHLYDDCPKQPPSSELAAIDNRHYLLTNRHGKAPIRSVHDWQTFNLGGATCAPQTPEYAAKLRARGIEQGPHEMGLIDPCHFQRLARMKDEEERRARMERRLATIERYDEEMVARADDNENLAGVQNGGKSYRY